MRNSMKFMHTQEFGDKSGYGFLAADIIGSAIDDWEEDEFVGWIHSNQSCLWCDYLGWDKGWILRVWKEEFGIQ